MWNLKNKKKNVCNKTETLTDIENKLVVTSGYRDEGFRQGRGRGLRDTNYYV